MAKAYNPQDITPLGFHNFRGNHEQKFGIKLDDRRRHVYVIGKTGVGKSTLMENMAIADIKAGKGIAVIDPHGELAEKLLDYIPEERLDDVIYFDPADMEYPIAFNPMEQVSGEFRHLVASGIMGVFKKIWVDAWSARMEYILNNTLLALLELPNSTILGVLRMFAEPPYRKKIVENLQDPVIKAFWQNEFARYSQKLETEALAAIQNKVGQFVSNPLIRNILGQPRSSINMRDIMDSGKIFIANLSKGKMGEDNSALLGAMIISRLQLAAMSRVDIPEDKRRDFFMYVDEFQNFATDSFASILSEARKYRLSLTLAHQYIGQLVSSDGNAKIRDAVFGNVGTIVSFRVGAADGEFLEKEFEPEFMQNDLVNLPKYNMYVKLMIDGVSSRPFSAETISPHSAPLISYKDIIIKNTREHYGTPRKVVDERIASEWAQESDQAINEKLGRRDERRLSEVLRPGAPRLNAAGGQGGSLRARPAAVGPRPPASNSASSAPTSGTSSERPVAEAHTPMNSSGAAYAEPQSELPPLKKSDDRANTPPVQHTPPSEPEISAYAPPKPKPQSQPQPHTEQAQPSTAPAGRIPKTSPQTQQSLTMEDNVSDDAAAETPTSAPKKFERPKVDIEALRRSINESLAKQQDEHQKEQPVASAARPAKGPSRSENATTQEHSNANSRNNSPRNVARPIADHNANTASTARTSNPSANSASKTSASDNSDNSSGIVQHNTTVNNNTVVLVTQHNEPDRDVVHTQMTTEPPHAEHPNPNH